MSMPSWDEIHACIMIAIFLVIIVGGFIGPLN
jgi:hypothetical protein